MKFTKRDRRTQAEKIIDIKIDKLILEAETLEDLYKILELVDWKQRIKKPSVSPETKWIIGGNLLGIGAILLWEQFGHVISTKALGFVLRGRV